MQAKDPVEPDRAEITRLLNEAAAGGAEAARQVFPAVYRELHALAAARRARLPAGGTLQTTALVHEAYLRVVDRHPEGWAGMRHFYFTAARAMRDIMVEDARRKSAQKRGGDQQRMPLDDVVWAYDTSPEEVLSLDRALTKLEREDAEGQRILVLHFYCGVTYQEIAELIGASLRTVERKWRLLRAWLGRELDAPMAG